MCEYCENPMRRRIVGDELIVPMESATDAMTNAPLIEGWVAEYVSNHALEDDPGRICVVYKQPKPRLYVSRYYVRKLYGGPEEGGWGYSREWHKDVVTVVEARRLSDGKIDDTFAYAICRSLNRLNHKRGGDRDLRRYYWDADGEHFTVERYPGEQDTSNDPTPHYC